MTTGGIAEEQLLPTHSVQEHPDSAAFRSGLENQARTLIRQRPVVAVLAALGAGYLLARLFLRAGR